MRIKFRVEYRDLDSRACPPHLEETTFQKVKVEQPRVRKSPTGEPMFLSLPRSVTSLLPPAVVERRDPDELEYHLSWYLLQERMVGPKVKLRDYPWWDVERPMAVLNLDRLLHRWWSLRYGREPIPPWWEPWTLEEYQLDPLQLAKLGAPQEVDWTQWSLLPIPWGLHLYWIAVSKRRPPSTACGCGRPLRLYNVEPGGKCPACLLRARWEVEMAEEFSAGLVLIHHLKKLDRMQLALPGLGLADFRGSSHITAAARSILGLSVQTPAGSAIVKNGPRRLEVVAASLCQAPEPLGMTIEDQPGGGLTLVYGEAPAASTATTSEECSRWMMELLQANGPMRPKDMVDLADAEGYERSMVFRTAQKLRSAGIIQNTMADRHPKNEWKLTDEAEVDEDD